jgi:hypothetical protein
MPSAEEEKGVRRNKWLVITIQFAVFAGER